MRSGAKKYYDKERFGNRDRIEQFRYRIIAPESIEKLHSSPSCVYDHIILSWRYNINVNLTLNKFFSFQHKFYNTLLNLQTPMFVKI